MIIENRSIQKPFFSICIPQHNRTSFVIQACRSLEIQVFRNFEVCISDDSSDDGRTDEFVEYLKKSELSFIYQMQSRNKKYDANLRASISLARGQYCFLLGNDDSLVSPTSLQELYDIQKNFSAPVMITNFEDFISGIKSCRIGFTGIIGSGPEVAASNFRKFSFLGGVIFNTEKAKTNATSKWDGSEMYQMFIGCRIISEGGSLLGIKESFVRKGIQIKGEIVDSYDSEIKLKPCPIIERRLPFNDLGRLVVDSMGPFLKTSQEKTLVSRVFFSIYLVLYPFWVIQYRRVQSWNYAAGFCLGMHPFRILKDSQICWPARILMILFYGVMTFVTMTMPVGFFLPFMPSYIKR